MTATVRRIKTTRQAAEEHRLDNVVQLPGSEAASGISNELDLAEQETPGRLGRVIDALASARERLTLLVVGDSVLAEQLPSLAELWRQARAGDNREHVAGRVWFRTWAFTLVLPVHALGQFTLWFLRYPERAITALLVEKFLVLVNPQFRAVATALVDALAAVATWLLT
ncbi:hypothetical protein ABZ897_57800 [Nonomuraea sp. NPDC046802]|uniref:hypothetical protein n=1 Tax=Nonomuraea sp. NPDC046802 TaxID=3154919 RepID=UPI0033F136C0